MTSYNDMSDNELNDLIQQKLEYIKRADVVYHLLDILDIPRWLHDYWIRRIEVYLPPLSMSDELPIFGDSEYIHMLNTSTKLPIKKFYIETKYQNSRYSEYQPIFKAINARRGQKKFRNSLLQTYGECVVTGCKIEAILEAAHINPYAKSKDNRLSNGLLLRADIHLLFDFGLLKIENKTVIVSSELINTPYYQYNGNKVALIESPQKSMFKD